MPKWLKLYTTYTFSYLVPAPIFVQKSPAFRCINIKRPTWSKVDRDAKFYVALVLLLWKRFRNAFWSSGTHYQNRIHNERTVP